ncbi:unnamed protein product [Schistosoma margrebowiei]|uniref:Uncharacterized protein n=1 Tax=Schistosoma margrebowiei TaxID=48269 RepID=A0A183LIR9_9TREM|nr:unnamed protein product [Schistosoma margrebowiei]
MDRGTASISNILSYLVFNIIPTVLDIIIGVVYFVTAFNIWYGLLVFVTMLIYLIRIIIGEPKTKKNRRCRIFGIKKRFDNDLYRLQTTSRDGQKSRNKDRASITVINENNFIQFKVR